MTIASRITVNVRVLMTCIFVCFMSQVALAEAPLALTKQSPLILKIQRSVPYYTLPISAMRKVNGEIGAEYNLFLSGNLTSYTWEMLPGLSAKIAHNIALDELKTQDTQVMYQCHGRTCGSSNQWANKVFGESRLYGLNAQQSYAALKKDALDGVYYYALYSTQRGNKKVYLHLDVIQEK